MVNYHKKKIGAIENTLEEYYELYPDFDYKFYTDVYVDLRQLDEYNAISHWHYHGKKEGRKSFLKNEVSLKKLGTTDDISNLVTFLVSPLASFITGQIFIADGGQI